MGGPAVTIELLANPFCLLQRDIDQLSRICGRCKADLRVHNLWELEDRDLAQLPEHLADFIRQRRAGQRPGSLYSDAFIAGRRFHLSGWSDEQIAAIEQWIGQCAQEARP